MADFKKTNQRNLTRYEARFYPHQRDYFEVLKMQGRNVSQFIRVAVDRAIDQERGQG